jgi:multiple antibiotic resistance protein
MDYMSLSSPSVIDTFFVLLIGVGPKLALVPFLKITASLDPATKLRVQRTMLRTAASVALFLIVLGELLRVLLHFSVASLSVAGGVILLVLAVTIVLGHPASTDGVIDAKGPLELARVPLAVPYLLNPVGIVGLVTISAEAESLAALAVPIVMLGLVLLLDVAVFRWASKVSDQLDEGRMLVIDKVFGFLIGAIAVQLVFDGLASAGIIAPIAH